MRKIKSDDEVIVLVGKDKGKRGKVLRVLANDRVVVSGISMVKRHTKSNRSPDPTKNKEGGIIEKEASIAISNVAIVNPETNKADRVGFKFEDGTKVRIFKSTGAIVKA